MAQFYETSQTVMAPQQYEAAKKDIAYFRTLIDLAIAFYEPDHDDMVTVH